MSQPLELGLFLLTGRRGILFLLSLLLVGWGQPATCPLCGLIAAGCGFALFWSLLIGIEGWRSRFWLSSLWFALVQGIQLHWMVGHPYLYIYIVWMGLSLLFGMQFGFVSAWITKERLHQWLFVLAVASALVGMEWLRLFIFSGYSLNPAGLALGGATLSLQLASVIGVFGLSFIVYLTNLFLLRKNYALFFLLFALPYVYGWGQLQLTRSSSAPVKTVALVQTAFPCEEALEFKSGDEMIQYVFNEWVTILSLLREHQGKKIDLIVLPEYVVPYGTFYVIYSLNDVMHAFYTQLGEEALKKLPQKEEHLVMRVGGEERVNNAYWIQALANVFEADVLAGLEDNEEGEHYSVAYLVHPFQNAMHRYEKRVLLPLGEYIPFEWCRTLAASYGVTGSFIPGKEAKVFPARCGWIAPSICYEETFGHLMREARVNGSEVLVNLTNDGWYPHSLLPRQHLEHARLRTVEAGVPLIRSCNTGITSAIDSHGEIIAILGETRQEQEDLPGVLVVEVPINTYSTLYTKFGDYLILSIIVIFLTLYGIVELKRKIA